MAKPYEPRLAAVYREEIRAKMKEQFKYSNDMQIPAAVSYTHLRAHETLR